MKNKLKKTLGLVTVLTLGLVLTACGSKEKSETKGDEKIQITYGTWNLGTEAENNLERRMIKAYNDSQDKVEVVIDDSISGENYNDKLATASSAGKFPDVFMISDIPSAYQNEWLYDVSEFTKADTDFQKLEDAVKSTTVVGDQTVAIPFARHIMGYYINKDILNALNLDIPQPGYTLEELIATGKKTNNLAKNQIAFGQVEQLVDAFPAALSPELGWFTFTDGKFALDSNEMIQSMDMLKDLATNDFVFDMLSDDKKEKLNGSWSGEVFAAGQLAFMYDASYAMYNFQDQADFDIEFIGLPGGRKFIINDYVGVSKTSKHAQEAYEFAKYMSYGEEGFKQRLDITDENEDIGLSSLPVIDYGEEINDRFWDKITIPGIREMNEFTPKSPVLFDLNKVVPGYINARYEGLTGVAVEGAENAQVQHLIKAAIKGEVNYQDHAKMLQENAERAYAEGNEAMNK